MASKVYLIKASLEEGEQSLSEKARKLFKAGGFGACFRENDFTAVKVHIGEAGNTTYLKAGCLKGLAEELLALKTRPFLTDTNVLYVGRRHNAVDHHILAAEHNFGTELLGIPFIVSGGLHGTCETAVPINGRLNKKVFIASDIVRCQSILSVAHFTGHPAACIGAALKTLGMGCASKKGKMTQHAALTLTISEKCTLCGQCVSNCPADAITVDEVKAHINHDKCISCAECLAVCRFGAVRCNWGQETEEMQKHMAEHALGVLKGKTGRAVFFNFLLSITRDCDCFGRANQPAIVGDIGILASTDPVAVDKAALDLVERKAGRKMAELIENPQLDPQYQLRHAVDIGLGSTDYALVETA